MSLLHCHAISFGHCQGNPGGIQGRHCLDKRCYHTPFTPTVAQCLVLVHIVFNRSTICNNDEMIGVYLLGYRLRWCCTLCLFRHLFFLSIGHCLSLSAWTLSLSKVQFGRSVLDSLNSHTVSRLREAKDLSRTAARSFASRRRDRTGPFCW